MHKLKTIDVNALEWFDKVNGNSYFAGTITLNYGMEDQKDFIMPYQYGYGESYIQETGRLLTEFNHISKRDNQPLWSYCRDNNIILRTNIKENCLKRELRRLTEKYNREVQK